MFPNKRLTATCKNCHRDLHNDCILGDLKTRKSTGTGCQIEIYFSSQTSKFLIKYNLLRFQVFGGLIISLMNMIAKFQQVS